MILIDNLLKPEFLNSMNTLLGRQAMGLGALLALFALILMFFGQKNSVQFLIFAGVITAIGAVLQGFGLYENTAQIIADREYQQKQALPEQFWGDFFDARRKQEIPPPAQQLLSPDFTWVKGIEIAKDHPIPTDITLPPTGCAQYFAAVGPPANIDVKIEPQEYGKSGGTKENYYRTGVICVPEGKSDRHAKVTVTATADSNRFSLAFFDYQPTQQSSSVTSAQPSGPPAPAPQPASPPPKPFTKIVCIGEHRESCPGPFDVFVGCISDEVSAAQVCGPAKSSWRQLATVSGDHCGYGLTQIICG